MSKNVKIGLGVIIVLVLVFVGYKTFYKSNVLAGALSCSDGSTTCLPSLKLTGNPDGSAFAVTGSETHSGTVAIGSSGTAFSSIIGTTCVLGIQGPQSIDSSLAASTTGVFDCPVTGLTSSYIITAQLATSTRVGTGISYWNIIGAKASTTAGFAEVLLYNNGPAAVPSASGVGSSTVIFGFK